MSQKITPNLWCDGNAREIAEFYTAVFADGQITGGSIYPSSKEEGLADFQKDLAGKDLTIELSLAGYNFTLINAGPDFKPNPSESFIVNFDLSRDDEAKRHLDKVWSRLSDDGEIAMPLEKYPFSEYYGWVNDKYGFSWQLILTDIDDEPRPFIMPSLQFGGPVQNRAAEAIEYYTSVFSNARKGTQYSYGEPTGPATEDALMYADFVLEDQWFAANDSGVDRDFTFNEAISLSVICKDQQEIDALWSELSQVPEAEQCGWCKDKFGVSWQIVPENMDELMQKPGAYQTMMDQHKIVIAEY